MPALFSTTFTLGIRIYEGPMTRVAAASALFWSLDFVVDNLSRFSEGFSGISAPIRRSQPQPIFVVDRDNEPCLSSEIEAVEIVNLGLEDHGFGPKLHADAKQKSPQIWADLPLVAIPWQCGFAARRSEYRAFLIVCRSIGMDRSKPISQAFLLIHAIAIGMLESFPAAIRACRSRMAFRRSI